MPFVTENIGKKGSPEDWRLREAATFAFGSMLEGPSPASLAETVRSAMGFLLAVSTQHANSCLASWVQCCRLDKSGVHESGVQTTCLCGAPRT
jgi:hypothetical protein